MTDITNPIYSDPDKAREHLEELHWPNGPVCPKCGETERVTRLAGKSTRPGVVMCNACRQPFTVTVGTIMEDSKIPLNKWLLAFRLLNGGKKGFSAHELHRALGITYKSAWFLAHRIRETMKPHDDAGPLGGPDKVIEAAETFVGGKDRNRHAYKRKGLPGGHGKQAVVTLVERDGHARSFHVANVNAKTLRPLVVTNVDRRSWLMTDDNYVYTRVGSEFAHHSAVAHGHGEYVRGAGFVHSNTAENFFSIFRRGVIGTYHHISEAHLHRYASDFDSRYNHRKISDTERTEVSVKAARGRRLMYRQPDNRAA